MTSRPNEQQEPSMEEILSSIRRIIADEASDEEEGQEPARLEPERPERQADAASLDIGETDDDDVLELTEVVCDDGEVVELEGGMAQLHSIEERRLAAVPVEPPSDQPDEDIRDRPDEDEAMEAPAALEAVAEQHGDDRPGQSSTHIRDDEMEDHQTAMKKNGLESLVSDQTAGAATGAFAKLSQAVQRTPPELAIADDSGRTVEQFVEDIMRPMLREWLDENLPVMVERIVQREIQKIVRRAEEG